MGGLVLASFLMLPVFARPVKFADNYRIVISEQDVGSLDRFVIEAEEAGSQQTEVFFTLELNEPPCFNPEYAPLPLPLSATLLEHMQRMVRENKLHTCMPCVLMLREQSLIIEFGRIPGIDESIWRVDLNDFPGGQQLVTLDNGNLFEEGTVDYKDAYQPDSGVETDEGIGRDEPLTLLGSVKDLALKTAPHEQASIEHVYFFGATMEAMFERLMERQSQDGIQTSENSELILFIDPFTASVDEIDKLPRIRMSSEILRYNSSTNRIIQEEQAEDPHPSHVRREYQLNEDKDKVIEIMVIREGPDSENNYFITFSLESEQGQAGGQTVSASNSSNTVTDEDNVDPTVIQVQPRVYVKDLSSE